MISSSGKLLGHGQHHVKSCHSQRHRDNSYHRGSSHMRFTSENMVTEPGLPSDPKIKGHHPTIWLRPRPTSQAPLITQ